jgi:outer membrane protein assembly factor BamB
MIVFLAGCSANLENKDQCLDDSYCVGSRRCYENYCYDSCQTQEDCPADRQCSSNNLCLRWCHLDQAYCQDDDLHTCNAAARSFEKSTCNIGCNATEQRCYQPGDLLWRYEIGKPIEASPALGPDGTIYINAKDEFLYAIDQEGSLKWRFTASAQLAPSPTVAPDGSIYVGSQDGRLFAISPQGKKKWEYSFGSYAPSPAAIAADGTVYIGSQDDNLYAVNQDGSIQWSTSVGIFAEEEKPPMPLAIDADGTLYLLNFLPNLYAVDREGNIKWDTRVSLVDWVYPLGSPAIGSDGSIYVHSGTRLGEFDQNGRYKQNIDSDGFFTFTSSPVIALGGTIYLSFDGPIQIGPQLYYESGLLAFANSLDVKWIFETGDLVYSTPAIDQQGNLYFGCDDSFLYALHQDGSEYWKYQTGGAIRSSPNISQRGIIYFGSEDGYLYALIGGSPLSSEAPWPKYQADSANSGRRPEADF